MSESVNSTAAPATSTTATAPAQAASMTPAVASQPPTPSTATGLGPSSPIDPSWFGEGLRPTIEAKGIKTLGDFAKWADGANKLIGDAEKRKPFSWTPEHSNAFYEKGELPGELAQMIGLPPSVVKAIHGGAIAERDAFFKSGAEAVGGDVKPLIEWAQANATPEQVALYGQLMQARNPAVFVAIAADMKAAGAATPERKQPPAGSPLAQLAAMAQQGPPSQNGQPPTAGYSVPGSGSTGTFQTPEAYREALHLAMSEMDPAKRDAAVADVQRRGKASRW